MTITREDERKLYEAYEVLDRILNQEFIFVKTNKKGEILELKKKLYNAEESQYLLATKKLMQVREKLRENFIVPESMSELTVLVDYLTGIDNYIKELLEQLDNLSYENSGD